MLGQNFKVKISYETAQYETYTYKNNLNNQAVLGNCVQP